MAVTSVRFNSQEEKLLRLLKKHYNCDASTLIKKSLWELYEDIRDREIIEDFEKKETASRAEFVRITELLS
jgi:hypothetical protein